LISQNPSCGPNVWHIAPNTKTATMIEVNTVTEMMKANL